mmetsp:Transcript_2440/g.6845  ORF Transcript_2440/g.6845 Transcript_2440/m.6845 type:complete len:234 (-) Transcript_2440:276-977(-)
MTPSGRPFTGSSRGKSLLPRAWKEETKPSSVRSMESLPLMTSSSRRPSSASLPIGVPVKPASTVLPEPHQRWSRSFPSCSSYFAVGRTRLWHSSIMITFPENGLSSFGSKPTLRMGLRGQPSRPSSEAPPPAVVYRKARSGARGRGTPGCSLRNFFAALARSFPLRIVFFISSTPFIESMSSRMTFSSLTPRPRASKRSFSLFRSQTSLLRRRRNFSWQPPARAASAGRQAAK